MLSALTQDIIVYIYKDCMSLQILSTLYLLHIIKIINYKFLFALYECSNYEYPNKINALQNNDKEAQNSCYECKPTKTINFMHV